MSLKSRTLRTRLIVSFVLLGLGPLLLSTAVSYFESSHEIVNLARDKAELAESGISSNIKAYFDGEMQGIVDLASSPLVQSALLEFEAPYKQGWVEGDEALKGTYRASVEKYYREQFGATYKEKTKVNLDLNQLLNKLDLPSLAAQYDFISENENPLGKKDNMISPKRNSRFAEAHKKYHTYFRDYLTRHALYDLFLVNTEGRIVYTVFKETDFSTSLVTGPWSDTSIASSWKNAAKLENGQYYIEDFALYTPSYEAPASFAGTPVYSNGKKIGVLMIQLPLDKITAVASLREGLGELGETLLLGSDLKLRADTFRNKKTHTVEASFAKDSSISVESEAVRLASQGRTGFTENVSYDGLKTLAYYEPLKIGNLTWYVVTELSQAETFAGLRQLLLYSLGILVLGGMGIAAVAYRQGSTMAISLKAISDQLNQSTGELTDASKASSSAAASLSEATTEQAASLQETMASIEQISAMVTQTAESAERTQTATQANTRAANDGSSSVDDMIRAIGEIRATNDEILEQMESSNQELSQIVKIIKSIDEKTNVINDIVFQTKLLSFNASVEAARAGEHGKGFAVVAEEVGNLAQMSGKAAREITEMLTSSINQVNRIVDQTKQRVDRLVETGKDKIAQGQSTAEACRAALKRIEEHSHSVTSMIEEITQATKEQSQGIQEITKAIGQLDQATQQNSNVAQQSSTQAEKLRSEASNVGGAVQRLIQFVDGEEAQGTESAGYEQGNVYSMEEARNKRAQSRKINKSTQTRRAKKAVGQEFPPSSEDSGFQDF
ncbi:MAG: methyl-accepting chemotaxis protein [Bdellovibrionales bacterium]